jgi:chloramphenicol O-acetyltransferase type A
VKRSIDLLAGPRRQAFAFYREAVQPRWGLTTRVDVAPLLAALPAWREALPGLTPFVAYHHALLRTTDEVPELRQRLRRDGAVEEWAQLDASPTILRADGSFAFARLRHAKRLADFAPAALAAVAAAKQVGTDWGLDDEHQPAALHTTVLPLVSFSDFSHARVSAVDDATPAIAMGRFTPEGERCWMPLNLSVHHAVVDGLHAGRFVQALEALLAEPKALLL